MPTDELWFERRSNINPVSDFHAHVHFWRLWSQLIMSPADPQGRLFIALRVANRGGQAFEGGGVEPKCPWIVDKLAGDPLVVFVPLTIAAEDQRSEVRDRSWVIKRTRSARLNLPTSSQTRSR